MEIGTLVKIKENTNDSRMPDDRIGIVVKVSDEKATPSLEPNIFHIRFNNGNVLRFHQDYLETISAVRKND